MKNIIAALIIFAASFNAQALDIEPMTKTQIAGEAAFMVLMLADYKQTMQITRFCDDKGPHCEMYETNKLLGRMPSDARIRNYFIGAAVTHVAITMLLPSDTRAAWIASGILVEAVVVGKNKRLGLHVKF